MSCLLFFPSSKDATSQTHHTPFSHHFIRPIAMTLQTSYNTWFPNKPNLYSTDFSGIP